MAGFMIDNIAKGTLKQWHLEDMDKISKDKSVVLLDVRTCKCRRIMQALTIVNMGMNYGKLC